MLRLLLVVPLIFLLAGCRAEPEQTLDPQAFAEEPVPAEEARQEAQTAGEEAQAALQTAQAELQQAPRAAKGAQRDVEALRADLSRAQSTYDQGRQRLQAGDYDNARDSFRAAKETADNVAAEIDRAR
jgi:TolA-binding protein